jgi:gamma-butyrobetaine dioxygenase
LDGAAIITNSPSVENELDPDNVVCTVGKVIGGSLSHGYLYGDTFHVKSTTNAINVAYTSRELGPHQDLTYYESKPGFQLLHCASMPPNIIGGESILIDSMAAAHTFRQIAPDLFATLVNCPATFVKDREGARMTYSRPHIVLQSDYCGRRGTNTNTNDNDIDIASNGEIVGVHWAPPFEGPLRIHPNCVEDYYRAYAAFELMLDDTKCPLACSQATGLDLSLTTELASFGNDYTWQSRLKAGEIMVFNNTRMLHGRRSFELPKSTETEETETDMERHLIGAYTNIDDSLNRYRVFLNEMDLHRIIPNVGNGSQSALPP